MVGLVAILPNLATASVPGGPGSENEIRIKLWVDYNNDGTRDTAEDETFARSTITIYNADSSVYDVRSYDIFDRVNGVVFNDNGQGPWRAEIAPQDGHTFSAAGPDQDGVDGTPITIPDLQLGQVYSVGLSAPWEVQLGRYGGGVIDGQAPFVTEPTTVCPANPAPGDDCGNNDGIIRGGDTIGYRWSVSASKINAEAPSTGVTLVQTITGDPGVVLGQAQLPAVCTTFSGASLTMINGDQQRWTIICNLGMWTDSGSSKLFRINVPVISGGNGSNIHSVATVHANSGDMGSWLFSDRAEPATEITDDTIISTAFHYDLRKEAGTTTPGVFRTVNGETLRGTLLPYYISLSSPIRSNQAPVDDKFTFVDDVFFSADGNASQPSPLGDLEHYIMECVPNADSTGNLPRGYTSTSWASAKAQKQAVAQLDKDWKNATPENRASMRPDKAKSGQAFATIKIPRLGKSYRMPIFKGTSDEVLAKGFGQFKESANPGESGNFALAAHRVTHGEPLRDIEKLRVGDQIIVDTIDFHYVYKVDSDPRKLQVKFTDTWVLDRQPINPKPKGMDTPRYDRNQLITLTTCAELFHTDLRTVVFGSLESTKPRFGPSTDLPEPIFPQQPMTPNPPLPNPSKK